jgi:hypothetical protein
MLATEQFKLLLETKHLCQRVSINPTERIAALCAEFAYTDQPMRVPKYLTELPTATLTLGGGKAMTIPGDESFGEVISSPAIDVVKNHTFGSAYLLFQVVMVVFTVMMLAFSTKGG